MHDVSQRRQGAKEQPSKTVKMAMTLDAAPVTRAAALAALLSVDCWCEGPKPLRFAFCTRCFAVLPGRVQATLYDRVGAGFERAYAQGVQWLTERRRLETERA